MSSQYLISKDSQYSSTEALYALLPDALKDVNIQYSSTSTDILVYAFSAIDNMILNVLFTIIGESDFAPTFGSRALAILFEPNDSIVVDQIEVEIYDRLRFWVPYIDITLSGIICRPVPEYQQFRLYLVYRERTTGIQNTFSTYISRKGLFAEPIRKESSLYFRGG